MPHGDHGPLRRATTRVRFVDGGGDGSGEQSGGEDDFFRRRRVDASRDDAGGASGAAAGGRHSGDEFDDRGGGSRLGESQLGDSQLGSRSVHFLAGGRVYVEDAGGSMRAGNISSSEADTIKAKARRKLKGGMRG